MSEQSDQKQSVSNARNTFNILYNMSQILNTGLSKEELMICVRLCEKGVNPNMLAHVVSEMKKEVRHLEERKKTGERGY